MMTRAKKTIYGLKIGILMLDTRFERLPGDIGYADTWDFPVQYGIVRGATPERVVEGGAEGLLEDFIATAEELIDLGVDGLTTSCGFLAKLHRQLADRLPVPIATSSLLQIPLARSMLPTGKIVGVLTADQNALSDAHFKGIGLEKDVPIVGMNLQGTFKRNLRSAAQKPDRAVQEAEVLQMAETLLAQNPNVGAIVSECTNLAPYSAAIQDRFDIPVFDIVTLVNWFHAGLRPRVY
jgi:phosphohistidine swiveling domain-containing protein